MRPVTQTVDGRTVHHSPHEGGDLVMLVRLAGAGGGVWDGIWPRLAERHAVAAVDLDGPDMSLPPRVVFEAYGDVIASTADALGHRRLHVVGWNGGAHIAVAMAVLRPPTLASVTLLTPFRDVGERRQIDIGLDVLARLLSGDRALYAYHWFMAGFSDRFVEEHFDVIDALVRKRLGNDRFLALDVDRAMAWMRALRRDHVTDGELEGVDRPVLILAAGLNRWHAGPTPAMAEALHRLIPQSELEVFDGLGAFFPIEAAEATAARILRFIEREDYQ